MPVRSGVHARKESIAPGGAARLGVIVHELCALLSDAIDVGRFPDHQTSMVDARLHPADIVAHDEDDVGFLSLLGEGRIACHRCDGAQNDKSAPDYSEHAHGCFPHVRCRKFPLPKPGPQPSPNTNHRPNPCFLPLHDHASGIRSDVPRAGTSPKHAGCAMRFRHLRLFLRITLRCG